MPLQPSELVSFLGQLKKNNNKAWFDANREWYQRLRLQWIDFTQDVIFTIASFDPDVQHVKPESGIFRINRDVRFSKDKSPYKTQFSAAISTHGRHGGRPVYYFHIDHAGTLFLAGGLYMPQPAQLQQVRELIAARPDLVDALYKDKSFKKAFPAGIEGDAVKRPPKGFDPDHPHIALIKHKSFTAASEATLDKTATVDKVILPLVKRQFGGMYPLITFLRRAVS
jgi:uncharacterized protein (TIGR02453 family)